MRSRGGPSPARSAGVADKAHHLGPRRRRGRDPATACRARGLAGGSEFTGHGVVRRAGNPGHPPSRPLAPVQEERPGHHRDPRSNHVVRRYASLLPPRTPTPSTGCRAACGSRPGTRVNSPGPHPQAHRVGRRQGRQAQAPAGWPRTPPGRLLNTDAPADAQKDELIDYRNRLNPAVITRRIIELQDVLVRLAKDKTDQHPPRPDPQHPARRPQGHPDQESPPAAPDHAGSST